MVFLNCTKEKYTKKGEWFLMLDDKICKLREELNDSILTGQDYSVTYELSIRLDELIAEYYKTELNKTAKAKLKKTKTNIKKRLICY